MNLQSRSAESLLDVPFGWSPLYFFIYFFISLILPDNLLIDYQFTFSLLQEDDRHYTAINFMATPEQVRRTRILISSSTVV